MGAQTILEKLLALVPDFEKCQQTADLDFIKNVYSKLLNMWIDFAHENQTLLSADYQKQLKIQMVAGKKQFIVENETGKAIWEFVFGQSSEKTTANKDAIQKINFPHSQLPLN